MLTLTFFLLSLVAHRAQAFNCVTTTLTGSDTAALGILTECQSAAPFPEGSSFSIGDPRHADRCVFEMNLFEPSSSSSSLDTYLLEGFYYTNMTLGCGESVTDSASNGATLTEQTLKVYYYQDAGENAVTTYSLLSDVNVLWERASFASSNFVVTQATAQDAEVTVNIDLGVAISFADGTEINGAIPRTSTVLMKGTTDNPVMHSLKMIYGCESVQPHTGEACSGCESACVKYFVSADAGPPFDNAITGTSAVTEGSSVVAYTSEAVFQLAAPAEASSWTIFMEVELSFGRRLFSEVGGAFSGSGVVDLEHDLIVFETFTDNERIAILVFASVSYIVHIAALVRLFYISEKWWRTFYFTVGIGLSTLFFMALSQEWVVFTEVSTIIFLVAPVAIMIWAFADYLIARKPKKGGSFLAVNDHFSDTESIDLSVVDADCDGEGLAADFLRGAGYPVPESFDRVSPPSGCDSATALVMHALGHELDPRKESHMELDKAVKIFSKNPGMDVAAVLTRALGHYMPNTQAVERLLAAIGEIESKSGVERFRLPPRDEKESKKLYEQGYTMKTRRDLPKGILLCGKSIYYNPKCTPLLTADRMASNVIHRFCENPHEDVCTSESPSMMPQGMHGTPGAVFFSQDDLTSYLHRVLNFCWTAFGKMAEARRSSDPPCAKIVWSDFNEVKIIRGRYLIYLSKEYPEYLHEFIHVGLTGMFPALITRKHEQAVHEVARHFKRGGLQASAMEEIRICLAKRAEIGVRHFSEVNSELEVFQKALASQDENATLIGKLTLDEEEEEITFTFNIKGKVTHIYGDHDDLKDQISNAVKEWISRSKGDPPESKHAEATTSGSRVEHLKLLWGTDIKNSQTTAVKAILHGWLSTLDRNRQMLAELCLPFFFEQHFSRGGSDYGLAVRFVNDMFSQVSKQYKIRGGAEESKRKWSSTEIKQALAGGIELHPFQVFSYAREQDRTPLCWAMSYRNKRLTLANSHNQEEVDANLALLEAWKKMVLRPEKPKPAPKEKKRRESTPAPEKKSSLSRGAELLKKLGLGDGSLNPKNKRGLGEYTGPLTKAMNVKANGGLNRLFIPGYSASQITNMYAGIERVFLVSDTKKDTGTIIQYK